LVIVVAIGLLLGTLPALVAGETATATVVVQGNLLEVVEAPVANFTAYPLAGNAPLTVQFTDTSAGGPFTSFGWDVNGDGTIDYTVQNPVHIYTNPGSYTVSLTVINATGMSTLTRPEYITVTQPGSIPSGGGGGGGGGGSTGGFEVGIPPEEVEEVPEVPVFVAPVPAPLSIPDVAAVKTYLVSLPGITLTSAPSGEMTILIDKLVTEGKVFQTTAGYVIVPEGNGYTITIDGNEVTISHAEYSIIVKVRNIEFVEKTIVAEGGVATDLIVTGTVDSIRIDSVPIVADLSIGRVEASFTAQLPGLPMGAQITVGVSETVPDEIWALISQAASLEGFDLEAVAYIIEVEKTNLTSTGPAKVRMSIPESWVLEHGGIEAIRIARISDAGEPSILRTTLYGRNERGDLVFEGDSPEGLSVFGMISVKAKTMANPTAPVQGTSLSNPIIFIGAAIAWIGTNAPLVGVVIAVVVTIAAVFAHQRSKAIRDQANKDILRSSGGGAGSAAVLDVTSIPEEQHGALTSIIHVLNEIDFQLKDLEVTLAGLKANQTIPHQQAEVIVERFFYSCQVAEERIKNADALGYLTRAHVETLNSQLHAAVQRMITLSQQSEILTKLIQERFGSGVTA